MYGYRCEYCEGTVQPRTVKREAFKHKDGFVILEDVTIGVCDNCGNRYYCADILHTVQEDCDWSKIPRENRTDPSSSSGICIVNAIATAQSKKLVFALPITVNLD